MAARRLIIVLVVLLAISIAAAAIAPDRATRFRPVPAPQATSPGSPQPDPMGGVVTAEIQASATKPPTVRAAAGDRLELSVSSERGLAVEIAPLGLFEDAATAAPARFDLLLREAGTLPITDADSGRVVGRIVVSEAEEPGAGGGAQGGGPGQLPI